ncbi:hypothetical protein [Sulfitobacter sp. BSw21498]|uniref:hypothetical protein n=1 Tax=Sulfitobacter sp. BSw21498 TaxID=664426 RepID=UPI0011102BA2|nr:hypothetical protein [Sulfitobacter sp. BSw21498]
MLLYKFVPTVEIAGQVAKGVYRFYELTKYRKLEENTGRSDPSEGTLSFPNEEIQRYPDALPIGSFNGVEFSCVRVSLDDDYLSQYFVFCASIESSESAIGGCNYMVELDTDIFDVFEMLLPTPTLPGTNPDGTKFFSHAPVEYYDINNHPARMEGEAWKEAFIKHNKFRYQNEYRAAMFISDEYFIKAGTRFLTYRTHGRDETGDLTCPPRLPHS